MTAKGSITIAGHSKQTSSSYPTCLGPFNFPFHTTKATGNLAGKSYKGLGHLDLVEHSANVTDNGTFKMKLRSSPLTRATRKARHARYWWTTRPPNDVARGSSTRDRSCGRWRAESVREHRFTFPADW